MGNIIKRKEISKLQNMNHVIVIRNGNTSNSDRIHENLDLIWLISYYKKKFNSYPILQNQDGESNFTQCRIITWRRGWGRGRGRGRGRQREREKERLQQWQPGRCRCRRPKPRSDEECDEPTWNTIPLGNLAFLPSTSLPASRTTLPSLF